MQGVEGDRQQARRACCQILCSRTCSLAVHPPIYTAADPCLPQATRFAARSCHARGPALLTGASCWSRYPSLRASSIFSRQDSGGRACSICLPIHGPARLPPDPAFAPASVPGLFTLEGSELPRGDTPILSCGCCTCLPVSARSCLPGPLPGCPPACLLSWLSSPPQQLRSCPCSCVCAGGGGGWQQGGL